MNIDISIKYDIDKLAQLSQQWHSLAFEKISKLQGRFAYVSFSILSNLD